MSNYTTLKKQIFFFFRDFKSQSLFQRLILILQILSAAPMTQLNCPAEESLQSQVNIFHQRSTKSKEKKIKSTTKKNKKKSLGSLGKEA